MHVVHHAEGAHPRRAFELPVRVYYEDTDAAGVVYYANYLKFIERGRTECLRELGFEQAQLLAEESIAFVVRSVQADYLKPALLDDRLTVVSGIDRLGHASVVFSQRILRGTELLFDARITVACVDWKRRRSTPIPQHIRSRLEGLQ